MIQTDEMKQRFRTATSSASGKFRNRRRRKLALWSVCLLAVVTVSLGIVDSRRDADATRDAPTAPPMETPAIKPALTPPATPSPPRRMAYGLDITDYAMARGRVKKNQNLSRILQPHGVGYSAILDAAYKASGVFDVRSLRPGRPFCLLRPADASGGAPRYFIYEESDESYVVFDLAAPRSVTRGSKPVVLKTRTIAGTVDGSLWQSLHDLGADPALLYRLSDIFAWSVDFYHLQKQDGFRVVYQEKWIDGQKKGLGNVLAAVIHHRGENNYAFRFDAGTRPAYYDQNGRSLEKTFLKAPLRYSRISSRFTRKRVHPVLRTVKAHLGTDYAAPVGTPVVSTGEGSIVAAAYNRANGRYIKIRHNRKFSTQYLHLSRFARGIQNGRAVTQGQVIGYVGATGMATGPHLCYRFWKHGKQVDPLTTHIPSSRDLAPDQREAFTGVVSARMTLLAGPAAPVTVATSAVSQTNR